MNMLKAYHSSELSDMLHVETVHYKIDFSVLMTATLNNYF